MPDAPAITQDIHCPQCEYNLRGLKGDVVSCPECGLQCDVARLITNHWTGPWQYAPGYSLVVGPSIAFMFVGLPGLIILVLALVHRNSHTNGLIIGSVVAILGWMLTLMPVIRHFGFRHGVPIALIAHFLLIAYIASLVGACGFLIAVGESGNPGMVIYAGLCAGGFYLCRLIDRAVAEFCIRLHLRFVARV